MGKRFYQVATRANANWPGAFHDGILVKLKIRERPGFSLEVELENNCNEAFLPQRKYALGLGQKSKKDFEWDSLGRVLAFDRFLVSNRDIVDWIEFGEGEESLLQKVKGKVLAAPATFLRQDEMQKYCQWRGKSIMSALVFDAASFFPLHVEEPVPNHVARGPYPWGRREQDSFLFSIKSGKEVIINEEKCNRVYAFECLNKIPFQFYSRHSVSWAGAYQVLGGYLEYLPNPVTPERNLKMSSFYFPFKSPWHRLGVRSFWDGKGHKHENFDQDVMPILDSNEYEVAFRCMRNVADVE